MYNRNRRWGRALAVVAMAVALTACGGRAARHGTGTQVSVPAYGVAPATTISSTAASVRVCRSEAQGFAQDAVDFLEHFGPAAAYPADLNFVILREDLARYAADRCDPRLVGEALQQHLTSAQRRALVADLPDSMAGVVREALASAGG
jgi:hypothetical protein